MQTVREIYNHRKGSEAAIAELEKLFAEQQKTIERQAERLLEYGMAEAASPSQGVSAEEVVKSYGESTNQGQYLSESQACRFAKEYHTLKMEKAGKETEEKKVLNEAIKLMRHMNELGGMGSNLYNSMRRVIALYETLPQPPNQ